MSNFGSGRCISRRLLQLPGVCSGLAAAVMQLPCVLQLPMENLTGAGAAPTDAAPGRGPDAAPWQNQSAAPSHPPAQLPRPARCSSHVRANAAPWRSSHAAPLVGRSSHGVVVHGRRPLHTHRTSVRGTPVRERQFGTYVRLSNSARNPNSARNLGLTNNCQPEHMFGAGRTGPAWIWPAN